MKKALILSLFIHGVIFASGMDMGSFFNNAINMPKSEKKGLSVEILSENYTPSIASKRNVKKALKKQKPVLKSIQRENTKQNKNISKKSNKNEKQRVSSEKKTAALPFSGKQYKSWLLEYYSLILKHIKNAMQDLNVNAGNLCVIIHVLKNGRIKGFNIVSSEYGINTESRIANAMVQINLPQFPEGLNKTGIKLKLNVVYK